MAHSIEASLEKYCQYLLRAKQSNPLTVSHYRDYLERFFDSQHIDSLNGITRRTIETFKEHLASRGLAPRTINYHLIALRGFIRWLPQSERNLQYRSIDLLTTTPVKTTPPPSRLLPMLLEHEIGSSNLQQLRDRAIVLLLSTTDIRLDEIPQLKRSDCTPRNRSITLSGTRKRTLRLHKDTASLLARYLELRRDTSAYLVGRHDRARKTAADRPMSTRSIQRLIKRYGKSNGGFSMTVRTIEQLRKGA